MSCKNSDNEIKKIILSIANSTISVTDITDNMNLIEDLNYDSIKMIQLIVEVEEKFNLFIDIENVPIKELYNVGTFINYVDILLAGGE
jgi:acyl carrier protein